MIVSIKVYHPRTGARCDAEITTAHAGSSYGLPVLAIAGELFDWSDFRPAQGLDSIFSQVYTAGVVEERLNAKGSS